MMERVTRFRDARISRQEGEMARLKVVQGPDYGTTWVILVPEVTIGRGDDSDIVITDLKASRIHARLASDGASWRLYDEKSSNGTLLNGKSIDSAVMNSGDTIALGESIFEFANAASGTQILIAPPKASNQIEHEKRAIDIHQKKLRAITSVGGIITPKSAPSVGSKGIGAGGNRRLIIYAVLGALLFVAFLDEGELPIKKIKKKKSEKRGLATFLPVNNNSEISKTANRFFKTGFREFRERNFLRAKMQFETALQVDPNHFLAKLYLQKSGQEIDEEVQFHLDRGRKNQHAGRLASAKGHYEAILRLLYRDQTNPFFIQAKEELKEVGKLIKQDG